MQILAGSTGSYAKTPFLKRVPTAATIALSGLAATLLRNGHDVWWGLLVYLGTAVGLLLVFHFVFRQPWARLLRYREYDASDT